METLALTKKLGLAVVVTTLGFASAVAILSAPAMSAAKAKPKRTTIRVVAGKPSEFRFKLSKSSAITPGVVVFKVTNLGVLPHSFKVCVRKVVSAKANACTGKMTKVLKKGQSTTLTVKLGKGKFEFLCTVPGHAAAGMKGLLGVGVKAPVGTTPKPTEPTPTEPTPTTPTPTTPTTPGGTEPLLGDPVAGKAVFARNGCASCHTLAAAGANGNVGPNLDLAKPTQAIVKFFVTNGGGAGGAVMPPFTMSDTDLNNLAAFVYQSTHS